MTLPMVTCPLCCRPGFSSSDSLCTALVDVTTRKLSCPICNHEVSGLDKFTIHLFSHSLCRLGSIRTKDTAVINQTETSKPFYKSSNISTSTEEIQNSFCNTDKLTCNLIEDTNSSMEKQDSWLNCNFPVKCSKGIPSDGSLIYFRTDNGQLFAVSQENIGSSLKNVTINTQNYITSTNITTSTLQTNLIGNVQKRKYCQMFDKDISCVKTKSVDLDGMPVEMYANGELVHSYPLTPSVSSETDKVINNSNGNERVFESCKDLLTKGDFSTNGDDLSDLEAPESCLDNKNSEQHQAENEDCGNRSKESTTCDLCSYVFPNKTILAMHNQLIHKKVETEIESKRKLLLCNLCPRTFSLRSSLMIHRRVAHAGGFGNNESNISTKQVNQNFSCQVCGKFFSKDTHLSQHMKAHDEKQWQCSICAKGFTTKYFLKKHRRLHTGEMPYRCKTCSKSFTFQQTYRKHLLYHNNDKPYCCAQCGRLFKELSTLHNHERIHSGEKPFTCETCGKAFRQRVSYLVHRRIHTGAMPYKCTACNKSFRYKISQRTHKCTAQPPGIVVRTQGYLVHRLQAAMNKVAENSENKNLEKELIAEDSSSTKSKLCVNSGDPAPDKIPTVPVNESCTSLAIPQQNACNETNKLFKSPEMSKVKMDKPQIYLLIRGPNGETYYQPLIMSQTLVTPAAQNNEVAIIDAVPSKCPKLSDRNSDNKVDLNNVTNNEIDKSISETIAEFSNLFGIKSSSKNTEVNSDVIKNNSTDVKSNDTGALAVTSVPTGANIEDTLKNEANKSNVNPEITNGSSIMSELFDSLIYVNNSDNRSFAVCNEKKEMPSINQINSDTNSDTVMDSADLFSLMLSPSLSSPSDRFGQLSLSPNSSSINTSLTSDNYESPSLVNCSLSNSEDVPQDAFFENLSDDTLKELLFGEVK